jgi:hypothetical protein
MAEFPLPLPFAEQGLHGVQIALFHAAHAGLGCQPARDPGRGKSRQGAQQEQPKQSRAKRGQGDAGRRFGRLAIIQIPQQAKPARRIGRGHAPARQNGPAFMGENLLKAWDFSRGGDQRRQMPSPRRIFHRCQRRSATEFADDSPDLGTQSLAPGGVQFGKARHAAFRGEEAQAMFACADRSEKAGDLGSQGFIQERR